VQARHRPEPVDRGADLAERLPEPPGVAHAAAQCLVDAADPIGEPGDHTFHVVGTYAASLTRNPPPGRSVKVNATVIPS